MSRRPVTSITAGFYEHFRSHPDRPCFGFADTVYTYADVMTEVQRILRLLSDPSFADERVIAVHATPDVHTYAAILAALASGRAYTPVHPQQPPERSWNCLQQVGTRTLLQSGATSDLQRWISAGGYDLAVHDTVSAPVAEIFREPLPLSGNDIAYLLFTSGSTGTPKGVPIYHRNLEAFYAALLGGGDFAFEAGDRFLQMFDLTFDLSIMSAFAPLLIGASSYIPSAKGTGYLSVLHVLERHQITVALMVPSVLAFLDKYFDEIRLPHLKYSMFCGEALPVSLAARWTACVPNARLFNVYGPTEATIFCTAYEVPVDGKPTLSHQGVVSIGRAMAGTRLLVSDEQGNLSPTGETGELLLAGAQLTDQYWRNAEKTAAAFTQVFEGGEPISVYRTGDLAFEKDGHFYYCGRLDSQVKIAGYRVELGEIEFHARKLPGVVNAAAIARTDATGSYVLRLFVESPQPATDETISGYRAALTRALPAYMVPQRIDVVTHLPLNANGKIDRKRLGELAEV
jgi:amino acid adenylation domain-containing protein